MTTAKGNGREKAADVGEDRAESEIRVLAFCWGNPTLVRQYVRFLGHLRESSRFQFLVVTEQVRGRLLFAGNGFDAVTLADVYQISRCEELSWQPEYHDPLYSTEYREAASFLGVSASELDDARVHLEYHRLYDHVVRTFDPDCVLTWNGGLLCQAALAAAGRHNGLPTFFVERGLFPGTFFVDPRGVNFAASVAGDRWPPASTVEPTGDDLLMLQHQLDDYERRGQSVVTAGSAAAADEIRGALGIPDHATIALVPLQLERDTNIRRFSPLVTTMSEVVAIVEEAIRGLSDVYVVVKPHPENVADPALSVDELHARVRVTSDFDLHSLLRLCDAVVTINSTVGLEARCTGKLTVTLGDSVYSGKGFTIDVRSRHSLVGDLKEALAKIGEAPRGDAELAAFLVYLFKHRLFALEGKDRWGSRGSIVGQISDAMAPKPSQRHPDRNIERFLEENQYLSLWQQIESGEPNLENSTVVYVGTPPDDLLHDVFEDGFRSTRVVASPWTLFTAIIESWFRPFDCAILVGELSWTRRLGLATLRVRSSVRVC